jgi:predicted nucleic acid-binding protein
VILVLDSSSLITLSRTGDLKLLQQLADTVHVPQAVYDEVVGAVADQPGGRAVELAQWIVRHQVRDQDAVVRLRGRLGRGEAEAIILAKELLADAVVLDDATARRTAKAEGCHVLGLLGLVVHAKERGLIPAVKPVLDRILAAGFYLDDELYRAILKSSREE